MFEGESIEMKDGDKMKIEFQDAEGEAGQIWTEIQTEKRYA